MAATPAAAAASAQPSRRDRSDPSSTSSSSLIKTSSKHPQTPMLSTIDFLGGYVG